MRVFWKIYLFLYLREQKILKTIKNNKYFKRYKSQNPSKYGKKRIYKNNKEENVKWKSEQDLKGSYFIAKKIKGDSIWTHLLPERSMRNSAGEWKMSIRE
jgi:hypothetical protein